MTDQPDQPTPEAAASLRHQAEAQLEREPGPLVQPDQAAPSGAEAQRLLHELQVHQVELELQNQTLLETRRQLEQSLENYTDLYDFAANVDGARVAWQGLRPILTKRDKTLDAELETRFAALDRLLAQHRSGSGYVGYDQLSDAQIKQLSDAVNALSEPLSKLTAAVI